MNDDAGLAYRKRITSMVHALVFARFEGNISHEEMMRGLHAGFDRLRREQREREIVREQMTEAYCAGLQDRKSLAAGRDE